MFVGGFGLGVSPPAGITGDLVVAAAVFAASNGF